MKSFVENNIRWLFPLPAALFIFGLLAVSADTDIYLSIYAVAFVLPYLTVMIKQYRPLRGRPENLS